MKYLYNFFEVYLHYLKSVSETSNKL